MFSYFPDWYWTLYIVVEVIFCGAGLVVWVLSAIALQTIAKRRGIKHHAAVWDIFGIGQSYITGAIADRHTLNVTGVDSKFRKKLLWLHVVLRLLIYGMLAYMYLYLFPLWGSIQNDPSAGTEMLPLLLANLGVLLLVEFAAIGLMIPTIVYSVVATHRLFRSCELKTSVIYTVIGLLVPIAQLVFLLLVRNKDSEAADF